MSSTKSVGVAGDYITSSRAAQLSGYSQDYVGQLCRSGSIGCKRVSGEWQVVLSSILAYKKRFNPTVSSQSDNTAAHAAETSGQMKVASNEGHQDTISHHGKTYVSSADAAKATGYSQDYIGQLARSGAVTAKKVGRKWFVEKASLEAHKNHNDGLLAAVQAGAAGITQEKEASITRPSTTEKAPVNETDLPKKAAHAIPIITYQRDDGSLVPGAHSKEEDTPKHAPEIKTMPQPLARKDLRTQPAHRSLPSQVRHQDSLKQPKATIQKARKIRKKSNIGRSLAVGCSLVFMLFIVSAVVYPDKTILYVHNALNGIGISVTEASLGTDSILVTLLDKMSTYIPYSQGI